MAQAVISTGGKQYTVGEGDVLRVAKLSGEPGDAIAFEHVLALLGDSPKFGVPEVTGVKVEGTIVAHGRDKKIIVFKFKRRKRFRKKNGHRQDFTQVKITKIAS